LDAPPRVAAVRVAANASLTFPDELSLVLLRSGIDVVTLLGEDGQMLGQVRKDPVLAVYLDSSAEGPAAFTVWTEAVTRNAFTRTLSLRERRFLNGSQGMMRVTVAEGEGFDGRILLRHTVAQIARPILPTIIYPHTDEVMTARRPARLRFAAGGAGAVLAHAEVMQEALAGLGLTPEARADGPFEEMDFKSRRAARLQQLRSTVQSVADAGVPLDDAARNAVGQWIREFSHAGATATQDDLDLLEYFLPRMHASDTGFPGIAVAKDPLFWRAFEERYAIALMGGGGLPERMVKAITSTLGNGGKVAADPIALRPALKKALQSTIDMPTSAKTVNIIRAAAMAGLDPVPALKVIDLTSVQREEQFGVVEAMRGVVCVVPQRDKARVAEAMAGPVQFLLARFETPGAATKLPLRHLKWLTFMSENGATEAVDSLLARLPADVSEHARDYIANKHVGCW
jgi:hypothetical protein